MSLGNSLNNPGDLEHNGIKYDGEVVPSSNPTFKQFETPQYGFRAMTSDLYHYINSNGYNTIEKIITVYAPPQDNNNTAAYINNVSNISGIPKDQVLTKDDFSSGFLGFGEPNMLKIIREMATIEQGSAPNENEMTSGYKLFIQDEGLPS